MEASACQDHRESVEILEREMKTDILRYIPQDRFLPYIQLHEFESLLFTDIRVLKDEHPGYEAAIQSLEEETKAMRPEEVDHERPPSKRIMCALSKCPKKKTCGQSYDRDRCPRSEYQKGLPAADLLELIGIEKIRSACPHFDQWLKRLEALAL